MEASSLTADLWFLKACFPDVLHVASGLLRSLTHSRSGLTAVLLDNDTFFSLMLVQICLPRYVQVVVHPITYVQLRSAHSHVMRMDDGDDFHQLSLTIPID